MLRFTKMHGIGNDYIYINAFTEQLPADLPSLAVRMPKKTRFRLQYHNRTKVLLCYALAWGLAILLPYLGLIWLYPDKLAGAAPEVSQSLLSLPLALPDAVERLLQTTAYTQGMILFQFVNA